MYLFTPALGRKPEEVVTSDLVAGGFPTDVGEGGVNLAIPLVATKLGLTINAKISSMATASSCGSVIP